jgi:hypothetical protein
MCSRASGCSGEKRRTGRCVSPRISATISFFDAASNGLVPVAIWYSTAPAEKRSDRESVVPFSTSCSGAM